MGLFKELYYSLSDELGREPTEKEIQKAADEFQKSYSTYLDNNNCEQCRQGVMHVHETKNEGGNHASQTKKAK
jgi:DNA-directed RNA polymerase specialized sigma subunit